MIDKRGREAPEAPGDESGEAGEPDEDPTAKELPKVDFSTFAISLASSAAVHLGLVADPESQEPSPPNLQLARQTIDTLEMLQEKTRGNLDADEERLLQNLLTDLRMRFVETQR